MEQALTNLAGLLTFLQQHFIPAFIITTWHVFVFARSLSYRGLLPIALTEDLIIKLSATGIIALIVAYALDNLNNSIIEMFQGYPLQRSWFGRRLSRCQERKRLNNEARKRLLNFRIEARGLAIKSIDSGDLQLSIVDKVNELKAQYEKLEEEKKSFASTSDWLRVQSSVQRDKLKIEQLFLVHGSNPVARQSSKEIRDSIKHELTFQISQLENEFSFCEQQSKLLFSSNYLMPTKLGNIIESFKQYSYDRYKIDAKVIYPKLAPLLAKSGHEKQIRQDKVKVDFFLNCSLLLACLSLEYSIGLICHYCFNNDVSQVFAVTGLTFILLSWLCYKAALAGALSWGNSVKTAFDLYRYELLNALSCKKPDDFKDEQELWEQLSCFFDNGYFKLSEDELKTDKLKADLSLESDKLLAQPIVFDYKKIGQVSAPLSQEISQNKEEK